MTLLPLSSMLNKNETKSIPKGFKYASQDTIIAVNPTPPATEDAKVMSEPAA
jgi:hypothetical protein